MHSVKLTQEYDFGWHIRQCCFMRVGGFDSISGWIPFNDYLLALDVINYESCIWRLALLIYKLSDIGENLVPENYNDVYKSRLGDMYTEFVMYGVEARPCFT